MTDLAQDKIILLVEDNPDDEALTLRALQQGDLKSQVVVTRNGAEALDYLLGTGNYASRDLSIMPQVVLLDLKLPKVDGLEVLRQMRADDRTRFVPVVLLSSSNLESDLLNGYRLGANSYVCKPVVFQQFIEAVRYLGLYWLLLNQPVPRRTLPRPVVPPRS